MRGTLLGALHRAHLILNQSDSTLTLEGSGLQRSSVKFHKVTTKLQQSHVILSSSVVMQIQGLALCLCRIQRMGPRMNRALGRHGKTQPKDLGSSQPFICFLPSETGKEGARDLEACQCLNAHRVQKIPLS